MSTFRNHDLDVDDSATARDGESLHSLCSARCDVNVQFNDPDKDLTETWMLVWSSVSFFAALFTTLTCLIDSTRFQYPERPIIFLSFCCTVYAAAYFVRLAAGRDVIACDRMTPPDRGGRAGILSPSGVGGEVHGGTGGEVPSGAAVGVPFLIRGGELEGGIPCMLVFVVMYFFGSASGTWWVMLAVAWFLASGRMWGREAIQSYAGYFHITAWTLPALTTITVLALRRVDGDELTGLCYVGNQDSITLFAFVVAPLGVYFAVGTVFVIAGFASLCRIRRSLKRSTLTMSANLFQTSLATSSPNDRDSAVVADIRKLEKLMAKVGLFSAVYIVCQTCVLTSLIYEQLNKNAWTRVSMTTPCRAAGEGVPFADREPGLRNCTFSTTNGNCLPSRGSDFSLPVFSSFGFSSAVSCTLERSIVPVEIKLLRLAASLAVGVASVVWVCSTKTWTSWKLFLTCRSTVCLNRQGAEARGRTGVSAGCRLRRAKTAAVPSNSVRSDSFSHVMMGRIEGGVGGEGGVRLKRTTLSRSFLDRVESKSSLYATLNRGSASGSLTTIFH